MLVPGCCCGIVRSGLVVVGSGVGGGPAGRSLGSRYPWTGPGPLLWWASPGQARCNPRAVQGSPRVPGYTIGEKSSVSIVSGVRVRSSAGM